MEQNKIIQTNKSLRISFAIIIAGVTLSSLYQAAIIHDAKITEKLLLILAFNTTALLVTLCATLIPTIIHLFIFVVSRHNKKFNANLLLRIYSILFISLIVIMHIYSAIISGLFGQSN